MKKMKYVVDVDVMDDVDVNDVYKLMNKIEDVLEEEIKNRKVLNYNVVVYRENIEYDGLMFNVEEVRKLIELMKKDMKRREDSLKFVDKSCVDYVNEEINELFEDIESLESCLKSE